MRKGNEQGNPFAKNYLSEFKQLEREFEEVEKNRNIENLQNICNKSFNDIAEESPQVIRQMIMEADDETKKIFQTALCDTSDGYNFDLFNNFVQSKSCSKVASSENDGVTIKTTDENYPYSSTDMHLNYNESSTGELTITKNLVIDAKGMSNKDKECLRKSLKSGFEDDFNCQIGSIDKREMEVVSNNSTICEKNGAQKNYRACPTLPNKKRRNKVKLKLNLYFSGEKIPEGVVMGQNDKISIRKCFNSDLPSNDQSNCQKIKKHHTRKCIENNGALLGKQCDNITNKSTRKYLTSCCKAIVNVLYKNSPNLLMRPMPRILPPMIQWERGDTNFFINLVSRMSIQMKDTLYLLKVEKII